MNIEEDENRKIYIIEPLTLPAGLPQPEVPQEPVPQHVPQREPEEEPVVVP